MTNKKLTQTVLSVMLAVMLLFGGAFSLNIMAAEEPAAAPSTVPPLSDAYLSKTTITKGESVTVYASKGGNSGYYYAYYYKKHTSEKWSTIKDYSPATSVKITPASAALYDICIKMKDHSGALITNTMTLKVNAELVNTGKISKASVTKGSSVTLKGSAKGGSEKYTFAYYYQKPNETTWRTIKSYSDAASVSFKPAAVGEYQLLIKAKDSLGKIAKKTFTLNVVPKLVNNSTVSSNAIAVGEAVEITAKASGGSGSYTYSYSFRSGSSQTWKVLSTYSTTSKIRCPVSFSGKITFLVKVKDSAGNVASKTFVVTVSDSSLDSKVDAVLAQIIKSGMTDFDKALAIHNWLVNNVSYDKAGVQSGNIPDTSFTAEGLFDTRVAVCDGYSKAFLALAERAGFDAIRITGTGTNSSGSTGSHAWNQIKIDGKWYNVDVTWDDPTVNTEYGDNLSYFYFLIPDSDFYTDHIADSAKNSCTAPQPVDAIKKIAYENDKSQFEHFDLCETESKFKTALQNLDVSKTTKYVFAIKTDKSSSETFQFIKDNRPAGYYSMNLSRRDWKLRGYKQVTINITV